MACECAELEWRPEDMKREHHPDCKAMFPEFDPSLHVVSFPYVAVVEIDGVEYGRTPDGSTHILSVVLKDRTKINVEPIYRWLNEGGGGLESVVDDPRRDSYILTRADGLSVAYHKTLKAFSTPHRRRVFTSLQDQDPNTIEMDFASNVLTQAHLDRLSALVHGHEPVHNLTIVLKNVSNHAWPVLYADYGGDLLRRALEALVALAESKGK